MHFIDLLLMIIALAAVLLVFALGEANDLLRAILPTVEHIAEEIDDLVYAEADDAPDMIAMLDAWRAAHSEPLTTEQLDKLIGRDLVQEAIDKALIDERGV